MKRYYMRAGMSPLDTWSTGEIIAYDKIGSNSGNLLYQYAMYRALMTDENVSITPNQYIYETPAEQINETYDAFIIPLADAFRPTFRYELGKLTDLIKDLKIPCVVTGVGLEAPIDTDLSDPFPFDSDVKAFMKAVLEKSAIVGVRGQITADYLTKLGFTQGRDHIVIGCPSMFTFGQDFHVKDVSITEQSIATFNMTDKGPANLHNFICKSAEQFHESYYIPQHYLELLLAYTGAPYALWEESVPSHPCTIEHPYYQNNRVRFFTHAQSWYDFMKETDFCFGSRFHGTMAAVQAGVPTIIFPKDARMKELAEYHQFAHVYADEITNETDIFEIIAKTDFKQPEYAYQKNFAQYISFLDQNELPHCFSKAADECSVFDKRVAELPPPKAVSLIQLSNQQEVLAQVGDYASASIRCSMDWYRRAVRLGKTVQALEKETQALQKSNQAIKSDREKLLRKNEQLTEQHNTKTVRTALKLQRFVCKVGVGKVYRKLVVKK